ncbi:UNVERIFIED_CONTAM: hypothetical protein K2H54_052928 [Gekko kuhli]
MAGDDADDADLEAEFLAIVGGQPDPKQKSNGKIAQSLLRKGRKLTVTFAPSLPHIHVSSSETSPEDPSSSGEPPFFCRSHAALCVASP